MTVEGIVAIITALSAAIVAIISVWRTGAKVEGMQATAMKTAAKADDKLSEIHDLANSNLKSSKDEAKAVRKELSDANERIMKLELMLQKVLAGGTRSDRRSVGSGEATKADEVTEITDAAAETVEAAAETVEAAGVTLEAAERKVSEARRGKGKNG